MIGLDTNVLARYLAQDDPRQSSRATKLIEQAITAEEPLFINHIVLCELAWVLSRAYALGREELARILEKILLAKQFEIEDKPAVWAALTEFKSSKADFADCLIGIKNIRAGCRTTYSFDQATFSLAGFPSVADAP